MTKATVQSLHMASELISFRADAETIERVNRLMAHLEKHPDLRNFDVGKAALLKMVFRDGLDAAEKRYGLQGKKGGKR